MNDYTLFYLTCRPGCLKESACLLCRATNGCQFGRRTSRLCIARFRAVCLVKISKCQFASFANRLTERTSGWLGYDRMLLFSHLSRLLREFGITTAIQLLTSRDCVFCLSVFLSKTTVYSVAVTHIVPIGQLIFMLPSQAYSRISNRDAGVSPGGRRA